MRWIQSTYQTEPESRERSSGKREPCRYNRADYYPTVTAGPSATRTRVSKQSPAPQLSF